MTKISELQKVLARFDTKHLADVIEEKNPAKGCYWSLLSGEKIPNYNA